MYLPGCYSMRFTTLSNYHLIDWWCEVCFSLFTWWFDTRLLLQQSWYGKQVYHPCITNEPTNQVIIEEICQSFTVLFAENNFFLKIISTTMDIIFCEFRLLYQIFFPPQVKQSVIKTNNYGIYELSQGLLNDVRLKIFSVLLLK